MSRVSGADVAVFSLDGSSFLGDLRGAEVRSETDWRDATPVVAGGLVREPVKRGVTVGCRLTSAKGGGAKVTNLDVGGVSVAGAAYGGVLRSGRFEGEVRLEEGSGAVDGWRWPVAVRKDYRARVVLAVAPGGNGAAVLAGYGGLLGSKVGFSVLVNGVLVELPMLLAEATHRMVSGEVQEWALDLRGSAVLGAAYPGSPVGGGSLLGHAFNTPGVPLSLVATGHSPGGLRYSGAFLVRRFGFGFSDASVVETEYELASRGVVLAEVVS